MGVGLAFSPGSSETACLLVPVLQKEVTNRSQAGEVLRISPDTKQNKKTEVFVGFARQTWIRFGGVGHTTPYWKGRPNTREPGTTGGFDGATELPLTSQGQRICVGLQ